MAEATGQATPGLQPRAEAPPPPAALPVEAAGVLIVDDNEGRLIAYEALLSGLPVTCTKAASVGKALAEFEARPYSLVLLDVHLPHADDGFEVARAIRQHPTRGRTPIIFVTADSMSELDQLRAYALGAIDYLTMPVPAEVLRAKVAVLLELGRRRRELEPAPAAPSGASAGPPAPAVAPTPSALDAFAKHPTQPMALLRAVRDDDGSLGDMMFEWANDLYLAVVGLPRERLVGGRVSALMPERFPRILRLCGQVLSSGLPVEYEARSDDGRDFAVTLFAGRVDRVASSLTDITELRRTGAALRERERLSRALSDDAMVGICHNDMRGRFLYANRAFCRMVGYSAGELASRTWQELTHPEDLERDLTLGSQVLKGETTHYTIEKRYVRKDGTPVWVELYGNFVLDDAGQPVLGVAVVLDITERRRVERELQDNDRRKDEFLAMLAHELRNPVAPIRNAAAVLDKVVGEEPPARTMVDIVLRQSAHLARILDDLLDVARVTQGRIELRRQDIELAQSVLSAVHAIGPALEAKGLHLSVRHEGLPITLNADAVRLEQCLSNLLVNAVKFTDAGGRIEIATRRDGAQAVIEVSDTGIGIAPELVPHLFTLFTQGDQSIDRTTGGLGLGLAICRRLVELHGGRVECRSAGRGQGATFAIRLPAA